MNTGSEDRVLVVEEADGRDRLMLGLEMAGYQVDVADDGEEGLIVAGARTPAAAVIDLSVPIIDGCSLAEALRQVFGEQIRLIMPEPAGHSDGPRRRLRRGGEGEALV